MSSEKEKIWHKNKEGSCFICGTLLGFYDSKYIEVSEPHRLLCPRIRIGDVHKDLIGDEVDEKRWYYWTDG